MFTPEKTPALFTISQKAILVDHQNRILIMAKTGKDHWDLPGGKLDEGEEMYDGLHREIKEETGLTVEIGQIVHVGKRHFDDPEKPVRVMIFYLCQSIQKIEDIKLSEEHHEWRLMEEKDLDTPAQFEINPVVRTALHKAFALKPAI